MSKIPQGEWSAIAARYAKGESISRIAHSYGCTPPAIHYILKRSRQRAAQSPEPIPNPVPYGAAIKGAVPSDTGRAAVQPIEPRLVGEPAGPTPGGRSQPEPIRQPSVGTRAPSTGLDSELHGRAEAAIAAFRSSFDAALVEGSPMVRQRLRQAAADLMRVAARTTIVLDRLNEMAEREPARMPHRSGWNEGR